MIRKPEAGCDAFFRLVSPYTIFRVIVSMNIGYYYLFHR